MRICNSWGIRRRRPFPDDQKILLLKCFIHIALALAVSLSVLQSSDSNA
jgi:hypothetical protein